MKVKPSFKAILSTAALAGATCLAVANAAPALSCPFSQGKDGMEANRIGFSSFNWSQLNPKQIGVLGAGAAAGVLGVAWLVRRQVRPTGQVAAADEFLDTSSFPIPVYPEESGAEAEVEEILKR